MQQNVVREGYDKMAQVYAEDRSTFGSQKYLTKLMQKLPKGSLVLDVGCGDGVPVDKELISKGYSVSGIDISPVQIERARKNCPRGEYRVFDMQDLKDHQYQVQAVVSFYAVFHSPRTKHLDLLKKFSSYLDNGGWLLITMGDTEWEGVMDFHGVPMWWSQYGAKQNRELVEKAGFTIALNEIDTSGGERHQVILAQKSVDRT